MGYNLILGNIDSRPPDALVKPPVIVPVYLETLESLERRLEIIISSAIGKCRIQIRLPHC
jgi:hypothetical protein